MHVERILSSSITTLSFSSSHLGSRSLTWILWLCSVFSFFFFFFRKCTLGKVDVHARTCSSSDCDISPSPSGHCFTHPSSVHPHIQNAPIPREQYLLLTEKKVTCSIISMWTFDLTFTEEAENSCRCEDAAGLVWLYILGWRIGRSVRGGSV